MITPDSHHRATLLVTAVDELFGTHTFLEVKVTVFEGAGWNAVGSVGVKMAVMGRGPRGSMVNGDSGESWGVPSTVVISRRC